MKNFKGGPGFPEMSPVVVGLEAEKQGIITQYKVGPEAAKRLVKDPASGQWMIDGQTVEKWDEEMQKLFKRDPGAPYA